MASDASAYRYASTSDTVLLVGNLDGRLDPVAPGNAQIIVSKVVGNTEVTVKVINVTVVANRYLVTLEANISGTKLSSANDGDLESLTISLTAKDQLGAIMKTAGHNTDGVISVQPLVQGSSENQDKAKVELSAVKVWDDRDNIEIEIRTKTTSDKEVTVPIQVTITDAQGNTRTRTFSINVKALGAVDTSKYQLTLSNDQIDLNFTNNTWRGFEGRYHSEIALRAYDSAGYLVKYESIEVLTEEQVKAIDDVAKEGKFYVTVVQNQKDTTDYVGVAANGNPYFTAVSGAAEQTVEKITQDRANGFGLGVYTVRAYRVNDKGEARQLNGAVKNIRVLDTTVTRTVTVDSNAVNSTDVNAQKIDNAVLKDKLTFFRGNDKIDKAKLVVIDSDSVQNGNTVYVRTITVKETYDEGGISWIYKINVNQQFYVR